MADKKQRGAYLKESLEHEKDVEERLLEFRTLLEQEKGLDIFDRYVFEVIIEEVKIGGLDNEGNNDPKK